MSVASDINFLELIAEAFLKPSHFTSFYPVIKDVIFSCTSGNVQITVLYQ